MLSFVGYLGAASMIALATARIMILSSVVKPVSAPPTLVSFLSTKTRLARSCRRTPSKEYPCIGEMIVMIVMIVLIIIIKR